MTELITIGQTPLEEAATILPQEAIRPLEIPDLHVTIQRIAQDQIPECKIIRMEEPILLPRDQIRFVLIIHQQEVRRVQIQQ